MPHLVEELTKKGLLRPPAWLPDNVLYLTVMGSTAYGCAMPDSGSDLDVYGAVCPPKRIVFPHTENHVRGFGKKLVPETFNVFCQHHVVDPDAHGGKGQEYDVDVKNVVNYFQLCMENNPNMLDTLFTSQHSVLYSAPCWQMVRENRHLFLSKRVQKSFSGYAYSQLGLMSKKEKESPKRQASIDAYGYDVKFAYHVVRLVLQTEQLLTEGTMDLMRNGELLKSVRRGEWTEERVRQFFADKERHLEELYNTSKVLPYEPDEKALRTLLLNVLETHYGTLKGCVDSVSRERDGLVAIRKVLDGLGV